VPFSGRLAHSPPAEEGEPAAARAPLRFGIMVDGPLLRWQAECIECLAASGIAVPALWIEENAGVADAGAFSFPRRRPGARGAAALAPAAAPQALGAALRIVCRLSRQGERFVLARESLATVASCELDFILRFAALPLGGDALRLPRCGIWSFRHGAAGASRADENLVALCRVTEDAGPDRVLLEGVFRPERSRARRIDAQLLGAADWGARAARELALHGAIGEARAPVLPVDPAAAPPADGKQGGSRSLALKAFRKLLCREVWSVGVTAEPFEAMLRRGYPAGVTWFDASPGAEFVADPFVCETGSGAFVLAEHLDPAVGRGRIVALGLDGAGFLPGVTPVMELPVHLSYPYAFRWDGNWYLVPEMAESGEVRAFRWEAGAWCDAGRLLDFPGLDSTIFEHEGLWWLFCTRFDPLSEYKLHAWHAPTPLGPWTAHALNPLKCDARSSRPGGRPFVHEGRLYRPAQDGSRTYGGALTLNWVKELTPTRFDEIPVAALGPDPRGPYPDGLHTISIFGDLKIIDGKRYEPRFARWIRARRVARNTSGRAPRRHPGAGS
jgi:hypothetical protein